MDEYRLKPGIYVICDPGFFIKKNNKGNRLIQKIIKRFYKDANHFHHMKIDGIEMYVFRSEGGDGIFDGVGTDTGLIAIVETNQLKDDERFRQDYSTGKIIRFKAESFVTARVDHFDLILSNGISVHTI